MKNFIDPKVEVLTIDVEDVITTSFNPDVGSEGDED